MSNMWGKRIIITIDFYNQSGVFNYPKHVPIPKIGEMVEYLGHSQEVYDVRHSIKESGIAYIRIYCKPRLNNNL